MQPKYQVFVSSTYEDLFKEREQVIKATLEMGHIPVGMEMFSAADEEQWKVITRQIDQSDYYVVIIAHRYGSVVDGVSYTEKEYDYAVRQGVPIVGFIISDEVPWPTKFVDQGRQKKAALDAFKQKVRLKPVGFWGSADDLHARYSIALMKLFTTNPRPGWIRATGVAGPEVMLELSRLSSENATLRARITADESDASAERSARIKKTISALQANLITPKIRYKGDAEYTKLTEVAYQRIFEILAPAMQVEVAIDDAAHLIAALLVPQDTRSDLYLPWPVPKNYVPHWLADFSVLGLVQPSDKKHSVKDTKEYWSLTEHGRDVYAQMRRDQLDRGITPPAPVAEPEAS